MDFKEQFIELYTKHIKRDGADKLLEYLKNSDFFTAPASQRFHCSYTGGLCEHSINVFNCLKSYLDAPRTKEIIGCEYSDESIAIVALLHDLCKIGVYKKGFRNVKNESGAWVKVDTFEYDDPMPYGHGEKSVYIISGYMKLTREEAFAIRYHMGYSSTEDQRNVAASFEMFPLAFALSTADSEATYYVETKKD